MSCVCLLVNPLNRRCFQRGVRGRFSPCTTEITLLEKLLYVGLGRRRGNCKWCTLWIIHEAVVNDNEIMALLHTASRVWRNDLWRWAHWLWFPLNYELYNCYVNNNRQNSHLNYLLLCSAECQMRKRFSHSYKSDSASQTRCDCKHWACGLIVTFNMGILSCLRLLLAVLSGVQAVLFCLGKMLLMHHISHFYYKVRKAEGAEQAGILDLEVRHRGRTSVRHLQLLGKHLWTENFADITWVPKNTDDEPSNTFHSTQVRVSPSATCVLRFLLSGFPL